MLILYLHNIGNYALYNKIMHVNVNYAVRHCLKQSILK